MGGKVMRWFLASMGYLLYTLVVLVCLLWLLFPSDTVKTWFEQQLHTRYPHYVWKIGSLKPALPGKLELVDIIMIPDRDKTIRFKADRLDLVPDATHLFGKRKRIKYRLHLLGGTVDGRIIASVGLQQFEYLGRFNGLRLHRLTGLQKRLQRKFDGTVAGEFSGHGAWDQSGKSELKGKLSIADGTLQLKKPVLGLALLPYTKIESDFKCRDGNLLFEQGKLVSTKMTAAFSGQVKTGVSLAEAGLQVTGSITPRSELFAGAGNRQMAQVVRTFLQNGALPFTVSGTVAEPAIQFEGGLSAALKHLQGKKR